MWLLIAFIAVPLIEIYLFIQIGGLIGTWQTLGVVVLTAVLGAWLVRTQGMQALANLKQNIQQLDDPSTSIAHGAMILFSGALLLTPGFFTDAVGFSLLVPGVRNLIIGYIKSRISVATVQRGDPVGDQGGSHPDIIDGEFTEVSKSKQPSGNNYSVWNRH